MDVGLLWTRWLAIGEYEELYLIFLLFHLSQDDLAEFNFIFECQLPHLLYKVEVIKDFRFQLVVLCW